MNSPTIDDLFNILDKCRHLPKYQLEPRASPFFELFLLDALNEHYKPLTFKKTLIPEFPIKIAHNYQSKNADFFALSEDNKRSFLIELKTDMGSRRVEQAEYLEKAANTGLQELVAGIISISKSKNADHQKYVHLLHRLSLLGLVCVPDDKVYRKAFPKGKPGLGAALNKVKNLVTVSELEPRIVYIQPKCDQANHKDYVDYIYFEEFADAIKGHGEIGGRFAKSLLEWAEVNPGIQPPAKP